MKSKPHFLSLDQMLSVLEIEGVALVAPCFAILIKALILDR